MLEKREIYANKINIPSQTNIDVEKKVKTSEFYSSECPIFA